ncbi:MAG: hypothetical protein EP343_32880 [Deltaproteobacteria bacterium]|nr:MAG: hypothetical protein EP343_32880 [Deltaproteobacteria bacterium]
MSALAKELKQALLSKDEALAWMAQRGYQPFKDAVLPQTPKLLEHCQLLHAPEHPKAPRLLFLWRESFREKTTLGNQLRKLQITANDYQKTIRVQPVFAADTPELFVLGCHDFLLFFPLKEDDYARRLRFSVSRLENEGGTLASHFRNFSAQAMAQYARTEDSAPAGTSVLQRLRRATSSKLSYDFSRLFTGEQLDQDFISLMGLLRRSLLQILLNPEVRKDLLVPVLHALQFSRSDWPGVPTRDDGFPSLEVIIQRGDIRNHLIAATDTVLLRTILYRYLEAQFGYKVEEEEGKHITFGTTFDDVLAKTTRLDKSKMDEVQDLAFQAQTQTRTSTKPKKGKRNIPIQEGDSAGMQLGLFAPPVEVQDADQFAFEVKERNVYYQRQAGGDLHQGLIAEAANVFHGYLLQHHQNELATLLEGTSAQRYSFAYADLDPRAFQRFYENTIGTDIRIQYDPVTQQAEVEVMHWHQNRKEQGAYFTDERICQWLVERSLGRLYEEWHAAFYDFLTQFKAQERGRMTELRARLDTLMSWKILDPTMGGGIFLRTAFDFLSHKRDQIAEHLDEWLPKESLSELFEEPAYRMFRTGVEHQGEWQWHILLQMLYGVDIDIKAVNIASNLLTLSALIYKPHGVCFPSFINTNLKQGNALVIPLVPEERETFAEVYRESIVALLGLRRKLRDPSHSREEWEDLLQQARAIVQTVTDAQILRCYKGLFSGLTQKQLLERVHNTGVFLYEIEFPEVFFTNEGEWKDNPGFHAVVGNPPWEEPASELKHFLPEFDPNYRSLSGPSSTEREEELLSDPEISRRWEVFKTSVEDFKTIITSGWYQNQVVKVRGRAPGAHTNLYKYVTELAYHYLQEKGIAGLLLDGGIWTDLSATGVRRLLLDKAAVHSIFGFVNHKGIFPDVHRSYKFSCNVFQKTHPQEHIPVVFMVEELSDIDRFEELAFFVETSTVRQDPSETYTIPELRSETQWKALQALTLPSRLIDDDWNIEIYSREFNAGEQKGYFLPRQEGLYPLLQGTQFNLFGVEQGELPEFWLDPSDEGAGGFLRTKQENRVYKAIAEWLDSQGKLKGGKTEAAKKWVQALTGTEELPEEWVRLDWEGFRIAWRDICRNSDKRTLIAAVLPRFVGVSHTAPTIRPFQLLVSESGVTYAFQYEHPQLLYLAGVLSSFACDSIARTRVAKTHLTANTMLNFHVPAWEGSEEQQRVAELTARLTCVPVTQERPWADYTDLAAAVGLVPERDGLRDPQQRTEAEVELNAIVAKLYGLSKKEFRFLMDELFMTKKYVDEHSLMRDRILETMEEE